MKVKKYPKGGTVKMTGGGSEAYYIGPGLPFLANALDEANVAGRKNSSKDVIDMWEGVKKSNPKRAAEILQRAKQFRLDSEVEEYGPGSPRSRGYAY